jgi:hypothetical protein
MRLLLPSAFILLTWLPISAAAQQWVLVGGDFQGHPITLLGLDRQGVRVAGGQTVGWDQVLELDYTGVTSAAATDAFTLRLNGGDSLSGTPLSIASDTIVWRQSALGRLEIPEDRAAAIVRAGSAITGVDQPRREDLVKLVNGDSTSGVVQGMSGGRVSITPAGANSAARIDLDKIAAVLLADPDPLAPPSPGPAGAWRVWLNDGSSLTVSFLQMDTGTPDRLHFGFGDTAAAGVDVSAVTCIERLNGPVRWLTDLTPVSAVYRPFLSENFPPRFDHPVDDPQATIRARFPPFRHGIGVHSYTKLTYAVPAGFATFRTQFAIERIAGSDETRADVAVRIAVDGKVVQEFPHVRFGPPADPVTVDVNGARELSLEVDYGPNLAAEGRFLWLDPAFVRSVPREDK